MKKYPIETEIGNITPLVFHVLHAKNSLFPALGPKERLISLSYQSLSMQFADAASYRQADALLNRVLHWEDENDALVEITLPKDANIYASEYKLYLPDKKVLQNKLKEWIDKEYDNE